MQLFRHLLVGLTQSEADVGLLRYAAMVARLGTVRKARFVHVLPTAATAVTALSHDDALAAVKAVVASHFTDVPDHVDVACDVLKGPLLDRLLQFAAEQEDDVAFVGCGRGDTSRRSLARRLAMNASCSLWLVPDGSPPTIRRILVPVDFSEDSADAVQVATSMARLVGATECVALHVYFNDAAVTFEEFDQVIRGQEDDAFRRFIAPIDCHGVRVTPLFVEAANVAGAILRTADEHAADLIVLASRGRSQSAAILLGSVAEATLHETGVATLVVKHFGARLGLLQVLLDRRVKQRTGPRSG